jgi:CO/xanthine dehydrogenase Mo-binding subunit
MARGTLPATARALELADGHLGVAGAPGSRISVVEVIAHANARSGPILGTGSFTAPGVAAMPGCAAGHMIEALDLPAFAVLECDVAVDPDTGRVEVLDYRVQTVGRAINPRAVQGQIQNGVVQGLGYALHEELTVGGDGRLEQAGVETYRLPLAGDAGPSARCCTRARRRSGRSGAKGAGEVPILNVGAAVAWAGRRHPAGSVGDCRRRPCGCWGCSSASRRTSTCRTSAPRGVRTCSPTRTP